MERRRSIIVLAGFTTCLIFGVSSRIFGRFFLLRSHPTFDAWVPRLALAWGVGLLLVSAGWFVLMTRVVMTAAIK